MSVRATIVVGVGLLSLVLTSQAGAQGAHRVADIHTGTADFMAHDLTDVDGTLYFVADDGPIADDLWKSDGTAAGTVKVAPGATGGRKVWLLGVGGTLFFVSSGSSFSEYWLWKSDGTAEGTIPLEVFSHPPRFPASSGGFLYFWAHWLGSEALWRSDGTPAGTLALKSLMAPGGSPGFYADVNGTFVFEAYEPQHGTELWRSDGTPEGTVIFKEMAPGQDWGVGDFPIVSLNGTVFFNALGGSGWQLWRSDGTDAGTGLLKDTGPSATTELAASGDFVFFRWNGDGELWRTDGTPGGTIRVKDIRPGPAGSGAGTFTNVAGTLFFVADDGTHGLELWRSDGTEEGTVLVSDLTPGLEPTGFRSFAALGQTLFFVGYNGSGGSQLWKSDGTPGGTAIVKDNPVPFPGSASSWLAAVGNLLYFEATDLSVGREIWKTDGTEAGTVLVADMNTRGAPSLTLLPSQRPEDGPPMAKLFANLNGSVLFQADDGIHGPELWKSDGTTTGTALVKDIFTGFQGSFPVWFTELGGFVFFASGSDLWRTDGSAAGTVVVAEDASPWCLTRAGRTLFFHGGTGLMKSDGTPAGTSLVPGTPNPDQIAAVGNAVFFRSSRALWFSDGTASGTRGLKDWFSASSDNPRDLTAVNGLLFFVAEDLTNGAELWKSDGTAAGTVLVKDIVSGSVGSNPRLLTNVHGTLFFSADDGVHGPELWKSDGTAAGTVLVKDIAPGGSGSIERPAAVDGLLYFGVRGELWKSDGTEAGTVRVKECAGCLGSLSELTDANGTLYFVSHAGASGGESAGAELWRSDGTAAGTVLVADIAPGMQSSTPWSLVVSGPQLFFWADDGPTGYEPWVAPIRSVPGDLNGDGSVDLLWQHQALGDVSASFMDGALAMSAASVTPAPGGDPSWKVVDLADFDGDGWSDILWQHQTLGYLGVSFMKGPAILGGTLLTPGQMPDTNWSLRAAADFNGDGKPDLLWQHRTLGSLGVWFMNGTTATGSAALTPGSVSDTNWRMVGIGDFNRDGMADLLWQHRTAGQLGVWLMNGTTRTSMALLTPSQIADTNWKVTGVSDIDRDGRPDLFWQHDTLGYLAAWLMNDTILTKPTLLSPAQVADTNWKIAAPK